MKTRLDRTEQQIEDAAAEYRPLPGDRREKVDAVLKSARKTRNINIRISESDLERLKARSEQEGLPYQTLISSILHKYVDNRLVEEEAIRKSLELLRSED